MTTFTDKELIKEIKERIGSLDVRDNIERRSYEIALASLEAKPVAWRYRYAKKDVTDSQSKMWVGDWKYVPTKEDCNDRPNYEIQELYNLPPAMAASLMALAAENARCLFEVSRCHQTVDEMFHHKDKWFDKEWLSALWSTSKQLMENTPATDAFLSELRAQGVEMFSEKFGGGTPLSNMVKEVAADFAAKLRKGGE